jgi:arylsulfatase A-like enzyme
MDALVQTTDLAPTILERAGVAPWNGIQGISLLAAFADERKAPYESLLIEEEGQRVYLGFSRRVRMRSLVTRSHRLSVYDGGDWGELYDFADDPLECVNRWDDRGSGRVRAELVEQLAHRMLDYAETSPYPDYIA